MRPSCRMTTSRRMMVKSRGGGRTTAARLGQARDRQSCDERPRPEVDLTQGQEHDVDHQHHDGHQRADGHPRWGVCSDSHLAPLPNMNPTALEMTMSAAFETVSSAGLSTIQAMATMSTTAMTPLMISL